MRKGFTMIELIFVIVIIGILAAVAIPRLAATRGDADGAKIANNLATCVTDAGGEYGMSGAFNTATKGVNSVACTTGLQDADGTACFTVAGTNATGALVTTNTGTSAACVEAHTIAAKNNMSPNTHQF